MGRSRTVFVFCEFGTLNGGENSFLTVATALKRRGWQFIVTAEPSSPLASACRERGLSTVPYAFHEEGVRKPLDVLRAEIAELLQQNAPNLVHCNSLSTSRIVGPVSHALRIPAIGYLRDIIKISRRAMSDINLLDTIVAVSNATRDHHITMGLSAERSVTIYNGLELEHFCPGPQRTSVAETETLKLLSVGQIGMRKGLDTLLAAIEMLPNPRPIEVDLIGERHSKKDEAIQYELDLRQKANQIGNQPNRNIRFLGRQSDIQARMQEADLLVHAANQEPLGRVLLEAFACGLPVVATDVGGTPEIFADLEKWKLLCPPQAPRQMAEGIQRFLKFSIEDKQSLSRDVRTIAETRFSIKRTADCLEREYLSLLAGGDSDQIRKVHFENG